MIEEEKYDKVSLSSPQPILPEIEVIDPQNQLFEIKDMKFNSDHHFFSFLTH